MAGHGLIERDMVGFERGAERLIERDFRMRVVRHGLHSRADGAGQIALILDHLEHGACPELIFSLVG